LVVLTLLMFNLGNIRAFEKHPGIVNCNRIAKSNINNYTNLFVWLQGHLSSFFFGLQNDARHINVKCFFVKVTSDLNLNLLRSLLTCVRCPLLLVEIVYISIIYRILNSYENTFNGIVSYISINDESQFFLLILSN
jgi:hypothetical protein